MCDHYVNHCDLVYIETDFLFFNPDSNGDVYEGDWVNDLRQGHGIMKFVDGTIYGVSQVT